VVRRDDTDDEKVEALLRSESPEIGNGGSLLKDI
jgi:hypothetical protein